MKTRKLTKIWRVIFIVIVIIYIVIVAIFVYALSAIPNMYTELQEREYKLVKKRLLKAIDSNTEKDYTNLKNEKSLEFIISDNSTKKIIYSTIPITNINELEKYQEKDGYSNIDIFTYKNSKSTYSVWLLQYYVSPQEIFNTWSYTLFIPVATLVSLNVVIIAILFSKFIRPLERLRDNIFKMSKYQLDLINNHDNITEYDQLSKQLFSFSKDLENYIDNSTYMYTTLEKNLQIQNEKLDTKTKTIASLTHDLKAPLTSISLRAQLVDRNEKIENKDSINEISNLADKTINEINEISKFIYDDEYVYKKEEVDLIKLITETLDVFKISFETKELKVELDFDAEVKVFANKHSIKQVINNALSNITAYTAKGSNVEISCFQEEGMINIIFYNDAKQFSKEQTDNIFKLFYRVSTDKVGSGTGLFTIKRIVETELNGTVLFYNRDNGVCLEIKIKK